MNKSQYRIADLIVEIPATGNMDTRCRNYRITSEKNTDVIISDDLYNYNKWLHLNVEDIAYMESGSQFYQAIIDYNGLYLHSSAVFMEGKAYLFSGPCGVGKSTHTGIWESIFDGARIINDDKPALRFINNKWYAYGTPWSGKNHININVKAPLAGICFLEQGNENTIKRLSEFEAVVKIMSQTTYKFKYVERMDKLISSVNLLVNKIPIYELTNRPEPEAARLSYETMRRGAEEAGL